MEKQIITNGINLIDINKDDALRLELEINLYENKDYWREIGDKLYDFHSKDVNKSIEVNLEKFQRILQTLKKLNIIYAVGFKSN
jgi:hypothetical protein|tara:strand:- start:127 stop:378 length:252 start_codon:yes stop_codon:yes gene_type:complete